MTSIKRLMPIVVNVGTITYCYLLLLGLENPQNVTQSVKAENTATSEQAFWEQ